MNFVDNILLSLDLLNKREFLGHVANYLRQYPSESESGYSFLPSDGLECRENFNEADLFYVQNKDVWANESIELEQLYQTILDKMNEYEIDLVDNQDFLEFILFERFEEGLLDRASKPFFLSYYGAHSITTVEELESALLAMYNFRVELDLEFPFMFDLPVFASVASCEYSTRLANIYIQGKILNALNDGLTLFNMRDYLKCIADWLDEVHVTSL